MTVPHDQTYLLTQQYRNAQKLDARIALHRRFSTAAGSWFRWLYDRMELPESAAILELGAGTGAFWRENSDRIDHRWTVTLSDLSPGMLDEARHSLADVPASIAFDIIDAQAIPLPDASFDVVLANHMLYHVPDRPTALAEIRRVLKAGGVLHASTNGLRHLEEIYDLAGRFFGAPADAERAEAVFGLETGKTQLLECFPRVEVHRRANNVVVTEPEALVAYLVSMRSAAHATPQQIARLTSWVGQEIAANGALHITVDAGLLTAR